MERRLTTELYLHFSRMFAALEDEGRKDLGDIMVLLNGEAIWERFSAELRDIVLEYVASAAQIGSESAETQLSIDLNWELLNPRVAQWAGEHAAKLVTAIADTTRRSLNRLITDGLARGDGWRQLRDAFEREGFSRARAERIARTEVIRAHSRGATLGYEESGVVRGVKWLDGQAGACPLCRELNGQTRKLHEPFYRDAFGDGYPPRHPNCRCATAPITLDMVAQLPTDHPLQDNRRNSVAELTDNDAYVEIGEVRITGERRRHWREQHGAHFAELEAMIPTIITDGTAKAHNGRVLTYPRDKSTTYVMPLGWDEVNRQWFALSLYFRRAKQVAKWALWQ